ncbi:MAG: hypothetical protein DBX41_06910, partial [Clostridiales bacterium]
QFVDNLWITVFFMLIKCVYNICLWICGQEANIFHMLIHICKQAFLSAFFYFSTYPQPLLLLLLYTI